MPRPSRRISGTYRRIGTRPPRTSIRLSAFPGLNRARLRAKVYCADYHFNDPVICARSSYHPRTCRRRPGPQQHAAIKGSAEGIVPAPVRLGSLNISIRLFPLSETMLYGLIRPVLKVFRFWAATAVADSSGTGHFSYHHSLQARSVFPVMARWRVFPLLVSTLSWPRRKDPHWGDILIRRGRFAVELLSGSGAGQPAQ